MVALHSTLVADNESSVFYIDTEKTFSSARLSEMLRENHPEWPDEKIIEIISRVTVFQPTTSPQLVDTLKNIQDQLIEQNVKMLIIDSLASIIRVEYDKESVASRQALLSQVVSLLKYYAHELQLAVVVVNQVTSNVNSGFATAALGLAWFHWVNTRLVLDFPNISLGELDSIVGGIRQLTVAKSPVSPVVTVYYHITGQGISLLKKSEEEPMEVEGQAKEDDWDDYVADIHPWNYWNNTISTRTDNPGANPAGGFNQ